MDPMVIKATSNLLSHFSGKLHLRVFKLQHQYLFIVLHQGKVT